LSSKKSRINVGTSLYAQGVFSFALADRVGQSGGAGKAREEVNGGPLDDERNAAGAARLAHPQGPGQMARISALRLLERRPVLLRRRALICEPFGPGATAMANENAP